LISVLSIADVLIGVFFDLFFPVGYFAQKSVARIASDLSFFEGAVIFFAGAIMAFLHAHVSSTAKVLLITGATMIGLAVCFGILV
jgi:CHASE2 domain-containing sensor protein